MEVRGIKRSKAREIGLGPSFSSLYLSYFRENLMQSNEVRRIKQISLYS